MTDLRAKQHLNRGYSDANARGLELALTPLVFGGLGWLVDGWAGTDPWLALGFGTFGVIGTFVKMKLQYDRAMDAAEAGKPWTRGREA